MSASKTATDPARPSKAPAGSPGSIVTFVGNCDASGAVPLSNRLFAVADDEDNVLRVYDAERGGTPLAQRDASADLAIVGKPNKKNPLKPPKAKEADIEAATRVNDTAFWLTSHARNSSGKLKPERFRFFATTVPEDGSEPRVIGNSTSDLLDAFLTDSRFATFGLAAASQLAPKEEGGLNIEGMTARPEGGVWIGFRNPNPHGKALLAALFNPAEMLEGAAPRLGPPVLLDLGGLGVSSLSSWRGVYLIAAASYDGSAPSKLFAWNGSDPPTLLSYDGLARFRPEGFFTPDQRDKILVLSDDGTQLIDGVECKKQKDPSKKRFRGVWLATDALLPHVPARAP
jgi:hypothetical protein